MSNKWTAQDIPDLTGKVIVITGANSGLGYESTAAFAAKGATIVMACRNMTKAENARQELLKRVPGANLDVMQLDNASLNSVRAFAKAFKAKYDRLDVLLNNAGIMAIPRQLTEDGFESQIGVNHLAHFALTGLLLDVIVKTPNARIHNVSSAANYQGKIAFDDLMGEKDYSRWDAYQQSKLANVFHAFELNKRLKAAGYDTIANTSHPGGVDTNLTTATLEEGGSRMEAIFMPILLPVIGQDVSLGVLSQLYGSTGAGAKGGAFYGPRWFGLKGYPAEAKANSDAYDDAALKRFWEMSEELTGVKYELLDAVPA
ncbi:MAG: oxidoreductase [Chloroflexota bacterium]